MNERRGAKDNKGGLHQLYEDQERGVEGRREGGRKGEREGERKEKERGRENLFYDNADSLFVK